MTATTVPLEVRTARPEDTAAMTVLIHASVRGLSRGYYTEQQVESAIRQVFGVDTMLVEDGTCYCVEAAPDGVVVPSLRMGRTI
jgi:hypothetical protein